MPLLLSRPSLCLVRSSPTHSDSFSSSLPQCPPCTINRRGADLGKLEIWKSKEYLDKVPSKLIRSVPTFRISHGWIATLNQDLLPLQNDLILSASSDTNPKSILLPPFVTLPHCQTSTVTNISMSSSFPEDEDCVVALKFQGPQLSFFRLSQRDSEWTNVRIENPCFYSSHVMFSNKHNMFCLPASGGHMIGSWDLHDHSKKPKLQRLQFKNLPVLPMAQQRLMASCCTSEHLVESPAGETFMVKCYRKTSRTYKGLVKMKTVALMVFTIDDKGNAVFTRDIKDFHILTSESEPFAVSASSCRYPGRSHRFRYVDQFLIYTTWPIKEEDVYWS